MKKKVYNKLAFILLALIISVFGIASIMLGMSSQTNETYKFYLEKYDENDKLIINKIYIGDTVYSVQDFKNKYFVYNEEKDWLECNENCKNGAQVLSFNIPSIDNLRISALNNKEYEYTLKVTKNNEDYYNLDIDQKSGEYYFNDQVSTVSTLINYVSTLTIKSFLIYIIVMFVIMAISYFSIKYIYNFINLIKDGKFSIRHFIISTLLLFIINLFYVYLLMQFISWLAVIPLIIILLISIIYISKDKKADISQYFSLMIMFIGTIFIFVFPPLHVPDETSHFIKSYQTSFVLQNNHETQDSSGKKGYVYLPKDFRNFIIKYGSQTANYSYRLQPRTYLHDLFSATNYDELSDKTAWYGTKYSSPIPYLPGAVSAIIARVSNMPIMLFYLIGKLFTFLIGSIMCYYAIKITPYFKKVFFIIPLLPMFFQQAGGYCMDWLTNTTFLLLLAYIFKQIYSDRKIEKKDILVLILLLILLSFCKFGYFPVALLILLIPKKRFSEKNKLIILVKKFSIIIIPCVMSILISIIINKLSYVPNNPSLRDTIPISTMVSEPFKIISMVIETFKIRLDLDFFRGMVTGFGWSTVWANDLVLFISIALLLLVVFCKDQNNKKLTIKQFIIILITFTLISAIIYGAMLFGWTTKDWQSIDGLQPRYFIPAISLLYIMFQSDFMTLKIKNREVFYSIVLLIINCLGLITIISGFYV